MEASWNMSYRRAERRHGRGTSTRCCRFETMEPRQLLAADVTGISEPGELIQPGGPAAAISGKSYATAAIADCESQLAASPLADVQLQLLSDTGVVLAESRSDEYGAYQFSDLTAGDYSLRQWTPVGYFGGTAHVGSGGGIAMDGNHINEIALSSGETLSGYDFCSSATAAEPVAVDATWAAALLNQSPQLSLSRKSTASSKAETLVEPPPAVPDVLPLPRQAAPLQGQSSVIFGGSSRALQPSSGTKAWDEDPFDSWFSTTSYWELADANQTAWDALEPILFQSRAIGLAPAAEQQPAAPIEETQASEQWHTARRPGLDPLVTDDAPNSAPLSPTAALPRDRLVAHRQQTVSENDPPAAPAAPAPTKL